MNARAILFVALIVPGMAMSPAVRAETIAFKAELLGSNESPANDSKANGAADATFDTETKKLDWRVVYSDLSGPAIGAHIHGPADSGNNAGILVPFPQIESPMEGSAELSDTQVEALLAGRLYVNVHTKLHPGGEIRGQLVKQ